MGGVNGNAGLFGNANDLAKLMRMYLNVETYGSERYIKEKTGDEFTSRPFTRQRNQRSVGLEKTELARGPNDVMEKNTSKT